jgi:MFS transporter, AAHS family, 4-hydroxybenzoate transporter
MVEAVPAARAGLAETGHRSLESLLDGQRLGLVQVTVVGLCLLALLIDGYDVFMFGIALPVIAKAFAVAPAALTGIIVAQGVGLVIGTVGAGPLADRFGRKPVLVGCVITFGLLTLATAQVHSLAEMAALRFAAAVFFSGVVPNAIALAGEMAPLRYRSGLIAFVFCGFPGGTALGGLVNGALLASHSWPIIFVVGGVVPLCLAVLFMLFLPESLRFRARRDSRDPRIARLLGRMDPTLGLNGTESFVLAEDVASEESRASPVGALFASKRLTLTLLLWLSFLLSLGVITTVASWSSTVWNAGVGLPIGRVGVLVGVFSLAGLFGTGTSGFVMDRIGAGRTLLVSYVGCAALMFSLAVADYHSAIIYVLLAGTGYSINSAQSALNAFSSNAYPTRMRATGVGWAFGAGRAGGILGPIVGGKIIDASVGAGTFFVAMSLPLLLVASLIPALMRANRRASEDRAARQA